MVNETTETEPNAEVASPVDVLVRFNFYTEKAMKDFYEKVYSIDNPSGAYGGIQWKGTDVSIDLHCKCGHLGHYDGDFFYFYECPKCKARYAVGSNVKLIPLTEEQAEYVEKDHIGFKTSDLDDDYVDVQ